MLNKNMIPKKLFRYGFFCDDKCQFTDRIEGNNIEQEKWKFTIFNGLIFPSSPIYFNDPYDCDLCIESSILNSDVVKQKVLEIIKKWCKPEQLDINRILFSDNIIEDMKIVLSHHHLGLLSTVEKQLEGVLAEHGQRMKEYIRVVCFTEKNDSILMWSHYAKNHSGFCIEYDLSSNELYSEALKRVEYTSERASIDKDTINQEAWFINAVLKKSVVWDYEEEWRLVIPVLKKVGYNPNNIQYDDFYINVKDHINAIYLGAKAQEEKVSEVVAHYKGSNVPIFIMELERDSYKLTPKSIL